jgi:hypothetical protein
MGHSKWDYAGASRKRVEECLKVMHFRVQF